MSSLVRRFGKQSVQWRGSIGSVENTESFVYVCFIVRAVYIVLSSAFRMCLNLNLMRQLPQVWGKMPICGPADLRIMWHVLSCL